MKTLSLKPFALVALSFLIAGCATSRLKVGKTDEGEIVEAEGLAPNDTSDLIQTKRASLLDAQKNAVEKVVGVFVSARTMVEKAVAIENNILGQTEGYVKKFDIIKEGPDGQFYKTKIRALVALKDLEADLRDMALLNAPELERPRVSLNLTETVNKQPANDDAASRALENSLSENGFVIVSGAREKEAELDITGKASAFPFQSEGLGGFVSYRARLTVQVARAGTDDVLVSSSKEASGLGGSPELAGLKALETVGQLAGEEISTKLAEKWSKGKNLLVFVEKVTSFKQADRIKKHLVSQPGVKDLILRKYDEEMAQYELQLGKVKVSELASRLESSKSYPMKVLESTNTSLRLQPQ